ncbi:MAG: hypothetical protein JO332_12790 [Planctomycetaceae bacterium]|nr:hypothetical protein [Planctomycetaceae bacterium]
MRLLAALVLLVAADDAPQKLKFSVEHLNLQTLKAAPLKPDEAKSFGAELKELDAVQDASCTETTGTVTLKPGATLKWTEIKATGKKTLSYDGGKPVIVLNTLKLEGSVTVTLHVEKNADKVADALKGLGFKDVAADGDNYSGVVKTPVDIVTLLKAVAKKTGNDYKLEIFKDAAWHAPAAK